MFTKKGGTNGASPFAHPIFKVNVTEDQALEHLKSQYFKAGSYLRWFKAWSSMTFTLKRGSGGGQKDLRHLFQVLL